jgi:hypothetical protein
MKFKHISILLTILLPSIATAQISTTNIPGMGVRAIRDIGPLGVRASAEYGAAADGSIRVPGMTCAAGRAVPFGTMIWIKGIGVRKVNDRTYSTPKNKGVGTPDDCITLCVSSPASVTAFGKPRMMSVYIIK